MRTFLNTAASLFLAATFSSNAHADVETLPYTMEGLIKSSLDQPHSLLQITFLDYSKKLAGCETPEPFLPHKVNSGGRATIGIRCQGREQSPVYLTAEIKIIGQYWVPTAEIARGEVITRSMLSEKTGDLATLPRNIIQDPEKIIGQQANRALKPGKPVQESALQAVYLVKRNAIVDVQAVGEGFRIKRDGVSMGDGAMGDLVKVKLKGGETVSATVTAPNVLNIDI
jgi:flagella basal body P-ring formation protein FlgA